LSDTRSRVLFVDDEENIRLTLGLFLKSKGFEVTTAATVPEALRLIVQQSFDILIADLNVGHPGDGFTVVSAMRRTHPQAVTFILTGYPAFETALEAIRLQVDDYLTKPTNIESLAGKIRSTLSQPRKEHRIQAKRLAEVETEHIAAITTQRIELVKKDPRLQHITMSDEDRKDHVPRVLEVAIKISRGEKISGADCQAASQHGLVRRQQNYTVPLLIREGRFLQTAVGRCLQSNLLEIEISYLVADMIAIHETIETLLEESVTAFLEAKD
jgi:DNA-binding NtrC family response regulator